ncbi:MAG TPA: LysR substrate-binding domain-containing protein [Burkholderiales bacterium]|jgi:DNA-binding transcriptional LysR family regulator|nr:LysR substrate-binding domain-containing protein [Burkholderiales bacterium]
MELRHLRYFVTVAEELHFGRAAEKLRISQPPLSMQIRALEKELGVSLLNRTQRHVSLTQAGNALLGEARQVLARVEQAVLITRRAGRGEIGELVIGFISVADYNVLPIVLREFRKRYPMVNLTLREATSDALIEGLVNGRIDVAFALPPIAEPALESAAILREPLIVALPQRHALARGSGRVPLPALAGSPFILFPRRMAPGLYDDIVSFCRSAGFSPRVEQEAVQMQTIVSLVSAELGVALIPQSLKNLQRTGVVYKALREAGPLTEIHLAWRRGDALPVLKLFIDLARTLAPHAVSRSGRAGRR